MAIVLVSGQDQPQDTYIDVGAPKTNPDEKVNRVRAAFQILPHEGGADILMIPYDGAESHFVVAMSISKELVKRGHKVTFFLHEKHRDKFKKYGDCNLFDYEYYSYGVTYDQHESFYMNMTKAGYEPQEKRNDYRMWLAKQTYTEYYNGIINQCSQLMLDKALIQRLRSKYRFVVVDSITWCRLPQYLRIPFAVYSAQSSMSAYALYDRSLHANDPAYYPEFIESLDRSRWFLSRVWNTAAVIHDYRKQKYSYYSYLNVQGRFISNYAHSSAIYQHPEADINLVNSHYVLDYQRPVLANTFAVGGLTTGPAQPLSKVGCRN